MLKEALEFLTDHLDPVRPVETSDYYTAAPVACPHPEPPPIASVKRIHTLHGLVAYCVANVDELDLSKHMLHIVSPTRVYLVSALTPFHRRRECLIEAAYESPAYELMTGRALDLAETRATLNACFMETDDLAALKDLLNSVRREDSEVIENDDMTQSVTAHKGIALKQVASIRPHWFLRTRVTFPEVNQPDIAFHVRLVGTKEDPRVRFREADGGGWKLRAMESISDYLSGLFRDEAATADGPIERPHILW